MQLAQLPEQLKQHGLPALIGIFSDSPLLIDDTLQLIRQQARQQGIDERLRWVQDGQFDWQQLHNESANLGLFSTQRLIELELPEAKPGREGADALKRYCEQLPDDQILVLTGPKLKQEQLKAKWFQLLQQAGPMLQANSPDRREMPRFVQQRAQRYQLSLANDAVQLLADWYEGNLLALDQELQKLALSDVPAPITAQALSAVSQDQSRFTVFALQDAIVAGDLTTALKRLQRLLAEETEVAILNWMLQREWQKLQALQQAEKLGQGLGQRELMALGIWRNQEPAYRAFAKRLTTSHMAQVSQLLVRLEYAFKRDSGESLATLYAHLLILLCAPQQAPSL